PSRALCRVQPAPRPWHHFWTEDRRQCRLHPLLHAAGGEVAVTKLPRAMLIDMDDTILSAYGRPEIAWNHIAAEFSGEIAPLPSQQVATAVLAFAKNFWANAEPAWRLKLGEARRLTVQGGFDALAAAGHARLPADLAVRIADRFTAYREEEMFVFPGAH